jgi:hypothetical protein
LKLPEAGRLRSHWEAENPKFALSPTTPSFDGIHPPPVTEPGETHPVIPTSINAKNGATDWEIRLRIFIEPPPGESKLLTNPAYLYLGSLTNTTFNFCGSKIGSLDSKVLSRSQ